MYYDIILIIYTCIFSELYGCMLRSRKTLSKMLFFILSTRISWSGQILIQNIVRQHYTYCSMYVADGCNPKAPFFILRLIMVEILVFVKSQCSQRLQLLKWSRLVNSVHVIIWMSRRALCLFWSFHETCNGTICYWHWQMREQAHTN